MWRELFPRRLHEGHSCCLDTHVHTAFSGRPIYLKILKLDLCQSHLLLTLLLDSCTHSICSLPFGKADPLQPIENVPLWALPPSPPDSNDPFFPSESMESLHLCPLHRLKSRKASALLKQLTNLYELQGAASSSVMQWSFMWQNIGRWWRTQKSGFRTFMVYLTGFH